MAPLTDISRAIGQQKVPSAEPVSRTLHYRKVKKPLLEKLRRARINRSLDEMKNILTANFQNDNFEKFERTEILERSLLYMKQLQQQHQQMARSLEEKYRSGFAHCAQEVSKVLATTPKIDVQLGSSIMIHLGHTLNLNRMSSTSPTTPPMMTRPSSSCSNASSQSGDYRPYTPPASPAESQLPQMSPLSLTVSSGKSSPTGECVWRPW